MALSNEILKDFFNKTKKSLTTDTSKDNTYSSFRVFDDPDLEINEKKEEVSNKIKTQTVPKLDQKEVKLETERDLNLGQSEAKLRTKLRPNLGQSEAKLRTKLRPNLGQSEAKLRTKLRPNLGQNLGQKQDKILSLHTFSSLGGLQRKITLIIHESCQLSQSDTTKPLSIEHITDFCKTTKFSVRKAIQRLEKKGIIIRYKFKNGRDGWTQYQLPNNIFQEIIGQNVEFKLRPNLGQSEAKLRTELRTELRPTPPSSSSSLKDLKTTTTTTNLIHSSSLIKAEFEKINFEPLEFIGFTKRHLAYIAKKTELSADLVQDSINAFAFDLKRNKKADTFKKNSLDVFISMMIKNNIYLEPSNYETPQQETIRLALERKKARLEKENQLQHQAVIVAFQEWFKDADNQPLIKQLNLKYPLGYIDIEGAIVDRACYQYYQENIWPNVKEIFLKNLKI